MRTIVKLRLEDDGGDMLRIFMEDQNGNGYAFDEISLEGLSWAVHLADWLGVPIEGIPERKRKVVINRCYGGFGLSEKAKGLIMKEGESVYDLRRDDERLVRLVEELEPEDFNTRTSNLGIVEIPRDVDWIIQEYDGIEWVAEKHRVWR